MHQRPLTRRDFLAASAALGGSLLLPSPARAAAPDRPQALIAITLDLEMSRNFPRWEDTHWDYEKGNLDDATKRYTLEAARRVKARGGVIHCFLVARVLEQENIDWLREIIAGGHSIGNHTYDHVSLKAAQPADTQLRFQRAPWLVEGKSTAEIVRENIRLASAAMKERLGLAPAGFRTPGGFANGLADRPDLQRMLLDLGFQWVSSKYPARLRIEPAEPPTPEIFASIVQAQSAAQPFTYPSGLIEIPMSPVSDIDAFRNARWPLEHFLESTRRSVAWAIEHRAVFDFLCHPSCLGVVDPEFRTIDLICDLAENAGDRAALVNLESFARQVTHP